MRANSHEPGPLAAKRRTARCNGFASSQRRAISAAARACTLVASRADRASVTTPPWSTPS